MSDLAGNETARDDDSEQRTTARAGSEIATSQSRTDSADAGRQAERTVAIHQPNYLPWIGFFHKIHHSDTFVFLDDVEYTANSWINRNKIKTPDGWTWLTVPVHGSTGPIETVEIANEDWRNVHRKSLQQNYGKAASFDEVGDFFETVFERSWTSLCELNVHVIRELTDRIGLECQFVRSSNLDVDATKTERIVRLCDELDADRYLSGTGARSYLSPTRFEAADVTLEYQSIDHPQYEQRFGEFVPQLSIVDVLMNVGWDGTNELIHAIDDP
ncbi:WbqC family protein [Natronorubrum halophilum]|uniref:WbqC family protein n=1 Tax=Natronorubrum halophilum TaxID=1702106 RepID=UPI001EE914B2|nr:WbqC family protein [Natronorubrum halophilum]